MTNHYNDMISELCQKGMNTFTADELLLWQYDIYRTFYGDPAEEAENLLEIGTASSVLRCPGLTVPIQAQNKTCQ